MNSDNGKLNGKLEIPSNVTRMTTAIKAESNDGVPQIVSYHSGVGSDGGVINRIFSGETLLDFLTPNTGYEPAVAKKKAWIFHWLCLNQI